MAIVSGFATQTQVYSDTRFPIQYRGGGNPNGQRSIAWTILRAAAIAYLGTLDAYDSDADAIAGGLTSGDPYWTTNNHNILPGNVLTRVP